MVNIWSRVHISGNTGFVPGIVTAIVAVGTYRVRVAGEDYIIGRANLIVR